MVVPRRGLRCGAADLMLVGSRGGVEAGGFHAGGVEAGGFHAGGVEAGGYHAGGIAGYGAGHVGLPTDGAFGRGWAGAAGYGAHRPCHGGMVRQRGGRHAGLQ